MKDPIFKFIRDTEKHYGKLVNDDLNKPFRTEGLSTEEFHFYSDREMWWGIIGVGYCTVKFVAFIVLMAFLTSHNVWWNLLTFVPIYIYGKAAYNKLTKPFVPSDKVSK
jgi:hypothetical protein